jgi:surface antigen
MRGISRLVLLASLLAFVSMGSYAQVGVFGNAIPLTKQDYADMASAAQPLLNDDSLPIGTVREWRNAASGNHGAIMLVERFVYDYQGSKLPCRKLKYHVDGKAPVQPYNLELNRCKVADGSWKIL